MPQLPPSDPDLYGARTGTTKHHAANPAPMRIFDSRSKLGAAPALVLEHGATLDERILVGVEREHNATLIQFGRVPSLGSNYAVEGIAPIVVLDHTGYVN